MVFFSSSDKLIFFTLLDLLNDIRSLILIPLATCVPFCLSVYEVIVMRIDSLYSFSIAYFLMSLKLKNVTV